MSLSIFKNILHKIIFIVGYLSLMAVATGIAMPSRNGGSVLASFFEEPIKPAQIGHYEFSFKPKPSAASPEFYLQKDNSEN